MAMCHYCKQALVTGEYLETDEGFATAEICLNEECEIQKAKNLYFKPWFLTATEIEARLVSLDVQWKRGDRHFFFFVNPYIHHDVRSKLEGINRENGSMLFDTDIDYVLSSQEEIYRQRFISSMVKGYPIPNLEGNK